MQVQGLMLNQRRRVRLHLVGIASVNVIMGILTAQPAFAGDASATSDDKLDQVKLQEVVVTAQKREELLQDVPISLTVLPGTALDQSTGEGLSDELNRVPGVVIPFISGANGASQISIRGVGADGEAWDGASPIAYYLDTVPFGFVRTAYIPDPGAFDLSRVEVLRGPQGTLFGANAVDGVVRVITNDADPSGFDFKARIFGSDTEGGRGSGGGDVAINLPVIPGELAVRGVVSYHDMGGWIDRPNDENANSSDLRDYRLKIAYKVTDALSIDLSAWSSHDFYAAPPTGYGNNTAPDSGTTGEPIHSNFDAYGSKILYQLTDFSITSMTSYLDYDNSVAQNLGPLGPPLGYFNILGTETSYVLSEELLFSSNKTSSWIWTAGVFYRYAWDRSWQTAYPVLSQEPSPPPFTSPIGQVFFRDASRSWAIFGQVGRRFLDDQFEWSLGLRQFHDNVNTSSLDPANPNYQSDSYNATTPRATLSWYPDANWTVYSSFAEGYRSGMPQYYQILLSAPSFPTLKPDKLYSYEVGTKADLFDHRLAIDASVYYVKWKDVQQSLAVPISGIGFIGGQVNGASASGPGVDLGVTVGPFGGFRVGGTVSVNELTIDAPIQSGGALLYSTGDRLTNSSKLTASLFTGYTMSFGGGMTGDLSLSGNYISPEQFHGFNLDGTGFAMYGNSLLSVRSAFEVSFPRNWSARLYCDNITNSRSQLGGPLLPGAPTTILEGLSRPRPLTVGVELYYHYK